MQSWTDFEDLSLLDPSGPCILCRVLVLGLVKEKGGTHEGMKAPRT
jgi:hypothetical protein